MLYIKEQIITSMGITHINILNFINSVNELILFTAYVDSTFATCSTYKAKLKYQESKFRFIFPINLESLLKRVGRNISVPSLNFILLYLFRHCYEV